MHLFVIVLFVLATAANADWWHFYAWDGLSCGDVPQNAKLFSTTDGIGDDICIDFGGDQKAYSYAAGFGSGSVEIRGYLHPHCTGPNKTLANYTCTNPEVHIPYIRSWQVNHT